jgi:hypothetical protein
VAKNYWQRTANERESTQIKIGLPVIGVKLSESIAIGRKSFVEAVHKKLG